MTSAPDYVAFEDHKLLADGPMAEVAAAVKRRMARAGHGRLLVFNAESGMQVDIDLRTPEQLEIVARDDKPKARGRPKLGVEPREVTLLPRHWEWLSAQPGGASAALRRLVEEARKVRGGRDGLRARREAAYRFMTAIAGNLPNYEDANRALFAGDAGRFAELIKGWPADVRAQTHRLADAAFD